MASRRHSSVFVTGLCLASGMWMICCRSRRHASRKAIDHCVALLQGFTELSTYGSACDRSLWWCDKNQLKALTFVKALHLLPFVGHGTRETNPLAGNAVFLVL
jgi:hypothetical protein